MSAYCYSVFLSFLQKLTEEETATIDKMCKEEANSYILFDPDVIKGLYRRGLIYFDVPVYPEDRFKGNSLCSESVLSPESCLEYSFLSLLLPSFYEWFTSYIFNTLLLFAQLENDLITSFCWITASCCDKYLYLRKKIKIVSLQVFYLLHQ